MAKKVRSTRGSSASTERRYRRNYLSQVIARIDFVGIPAIGESGPSNTITAALKREFPVAEQKKQIFKSISISDKAVKEETLKETFQWFFHSVDRDKLIHIAHDACYVEYKKYKSFGTLQNDFLPIVDALFAAYPALQVSRLGLRYVDTIELKEKEPTDWTTYLKPELLASLRLADDPRTVTRMFHLLEFNYGDMQMRFQFGIPNPDFPALLKRKQFTLDYDAYCTSLLSANDIGHNLVKFHDKIRTSFEEVITDGLRAKMGVNHGK